MSICMWASELDHGRNGIRLPDLTNHIFFNHVDGQVLLHRLLEEEMAPGWQKKARQRQCNALGNVLLENLGPSHIKLAGSVAQQIKNAYNNNFKVRSGSDQELENQKNLALVVQWLKCILPGKKSQRSSAYLLGHFNNVQSMLKGMGQEVKLTKQIQHIRAQCLYATFTGVELSFHNVLTDIGIPEGVQNKRFLL